jgi:AraC family transcriptional regulator
VQARTFAAHHVMAPHADGSSRLSIVIAGQLVESAGRRDEHATAGSLVIKPGDVVHRNRFGPAGTRMLSIALPAWLHAERKTATIDQWRWFHGGPLAIATLRLCLAARERVSSDGNVADRVIDVIATASDADGEHDRRVAPLWLARVHQQIRDRDPQARNVSSLAANAGVHPVYLARRFRRHFGCSVVDYLQANRLSAAVERMATTAEPLADVAAASGYADQSHFNRACRRGLGVAPHRCRRLLA